MSSAGDEDGPPTFPLAESTDLNKLTSSQRIGKFFHSTWVFKNNGWRV